MPSNVNVTDLSGPPHKGQGPLQSYQQCVISFTTDLYLQGLLFVIRIRHD